MRLVGEVGAGHLGLSPEGDAQMLSDSGGTG